MIVDENGTKMNIENKTAKAEYLAGLEREQAILEGNFENAKSAYIANSKEGRQYLKER